jgi:hypothetical protein
MRNASWLPSLLLASLAATPTSGSDLPNGWRALAAEKVVEVITRDPSGKNRETKVWVVEVDGVLYLRTSRSKWLENLRRDPDFTLRYSGGEVGARAFEIPGDAIIEAVDAASRTKYGWQQSVTRFFRYRKPEILRVEAR